MGIHGCKVTFRSKGRLCGVLPCTTWWVKSTGAKDTEEGATAGLQAAVGHTVTQERVLACGQCRPRGLGPAWAHSVPGARDKLQSQL